MKVKVCQTSEVGQDSMAAFDVSGRRVLVANIDGVYHAVGDTCSHAQASLSEGYLDPAECTVECPLHGAVFDLKTGDAMDFPAEDPVPRYAVTVEGEDLFIEIEDA